MLSPHLSVFGCLSVKLNISHHWFRLWLGTKQPITRTIHNPVCWHLYTSTGIYKWTHWGRVTPMCVSELTMIGSDNGLSPDPRQAFIWTNARLLLIGPLGTNFSEILIEILTFPFKKMHLKMLSAKRGPFCLGLNVLNLDLFSGENYQNHIVKTINVSVTPKDNSWQL